MSYWQKNVAAAFVFLLLLMALFPPFHIESKNYIINMGYAFIFTPPTRANVTASVDTTTLMTQWLGLVLAGAVMFLLMRNREAPNKELSYSQQGKKSQYDSAALTKGHRQVFNQDDEKSNGILVRKKSAPLKSGSKKNSHDSIDVRPVPAVKAFLALAIFVPALYLIAEVLILGTQGEPTVQGLLVVYGGYFGFALSLVLVGLLPILVYRAYRLIFRKPCSRSLESGLAWSGAALAMMALFGIQENSNNQAELSPNVSERKSVADINLAQNFGSFTQIQETKPVEKKVHQDSLEETQAKFSEIVSAMEGSVGSVTQDYNNELESIGVWKASDFQTLRSQDDVSERLQVLTLWDIVILEYRQIIESIFNNSRNEFKALETNPTYKEILIESYDLGAVEALAKIDVAFNFQNRLSSALRSALMELEKNPSGWKIDNAELVFYDVDLMDRFHAKQERIFELQKEMAQLVE